ncbi:potassium channel family protein [Ammoniphilus oxalaticus]|uniref:potassium channel family protein n=1 Tax=Ammoniphilus oxalaticus TaxID=66863 RepID=UPI000E713F10|nr:potassium channel family protein [Ammoniphilus oxalaticus]
MDKKVFIYNLASLFILYLNIVLSFSLLYLFLDYFQLGPIVDHYASETHQNQGFDRLSRSIYFSAITLMSVGYGDVTPLGWSKGVAIIEALLGFILPPALVVKYILFPSNSLEKLMLKSSTKENDGS